MLKHASNASSATAAVPVSGQLLRTANSNSSSNTNNSNCNANSNNNNSSSNNNNNPPSASAAAAATAATTTTAATSPVPGAAVAAAVAAAAAAGASPTPAAAAVASTARNIHLRPPQPLNISALSASTTMLNGGVRGGVGNASTLLNIATQTPIKPLTPLTPNGNCNNNSLHHHTYTNQHMLASSSSSNHQHTQQQQQPQTLLQQQQPLHLSQHPLNFANNNNNNNNMNNMNNNNNNNIHNYSHCNNLGINPNSVLQASVKPTKHGPGPREVLTSLGLLCLVSLLLALLSLIFLLKISPNSRDDALTRSISTEDFIIVYDVTLALCALSLSLNLCCLLVCAIQFLFAVKLLRSPMFDGRDNKYLEKSSASRTCAVSGFFISIPVFLTGIILYTFNHFHSTPAIITSVLIGVGIVFCGAAMVHNVFVWQKEKTISYRSPPVPLNMSLLSTATHLPPVQLFNSPNNGCQPVMPVYGQQNHSMLQHHHPTSVTPVSPNHSHGSFNPLLCGNNNNNNGVISGIINSPFLVRPATATPPTPKPIATAVNGSCLMGREASGSVSPGIPPTLDMSNITISLHELSTLV